MDRTTWAKNKAEQLIRNSTLKANWSRSTLEMWLRDQCLCVYCGRDMLEKRDTTYYFWCAEHLLPAHKYKQLKDAPWNQVLACQPCNLLKHRFDPASDGTPPDEAHKGIFIERAKAHITGRRAEVEAIFVSEERLLRDALRDFGKEIFVASC